MERVFFLFVLIAAIALNAADAASLSPSAFCTRQGGSVQMYRLYSGSPGNGQAIGYPMQVCSIPRDPDSPSSYKIAIDTLVSPYPTLAVLAFQSMSPYVPPSGTICGNPSACYCTQLNGEFSASLNLGWWPVNKTQVDYGQSEFCVFPDRSSIDPWTLFYHQSNPTMGGSIIFGYQPPNVTVGKACKPTVYKSCPTAGR
jgi:putative hemolysin